MVTVEEVRAIAASLGISDTSTPERLGFGYADKGVAWSFMQRDHPKQKRWPNMDVLAVTCPLERKALLVEAAPDRFFDDPHYNGFPAVLVRLPVVSAEELTGILEAARDLVAARPKRRKR